MEPRAPRAFQFHLLTALFIMVVLGLLTPLLLRAFGRSTLDGLTLLYTVALPIMMGAFEVEAFLLRRADPDAKYERPRETGLRIAGPLLWLCAELTAIGLWAICVAKVIMPWWGP
jgi:hypothetical protein